MALSFFKHEKVYYMDNSMIFVSTSVTLLTRDDVQNINESSFLSLKWINKDEEKEKAPFW